MFFNKKIDELLLTQSHIDNTSYSNTHDLTFPLDNEDIIYYKKIEKGLRCIFVPFYENIFVCINLSENMLGEKKGELPHFSNYDCKYILDLLNKDPSKIIVDNSMIVLEKLAFSDTIGGAEYCYSKVVCQDLSEFKTHL